MSLTIETTTLPAGKAALLPYVASGIAIAVAAVLAFGTGRPIHNQTTSTPAAALESGTWALPSYWEPSVLFYVVGSEAQRRSVLDDYDALLFLEAITGIEQPRRQVNVAVVDKPGKESMLNESIQDLMATGVSVRVINLRTD